MGRRATTTTTQDNTRAITDWIPTRGISAHKAWHGTIAKKPWEYKVTAVIPHLDTSELLDTNIALLRLQTERPFIVIVDTGSSARHMGVLDELERCNEDIEVHRLRFKSVVHPSDPVAVAMDLAFSACRTEWIYATHADCFLKNQHFIENTLEKMRVRDFSVAGYRITERKGVDTSKWVGHTATFFNTKFCDEHNLAWSQRKLCNLTGEDHAGDQKTSSYPDTEFLINVQLDVIAKDLKRPNRWIIGTEENYITTDDEDICHVRSYASSKLYSPEHFKKASKSMERAMTEAYKRIKKWSDK